MSILRRLMAWLADPLHLLLALLSLLPMILVIVYVISYRPVVPFRDEWNLNGQVAIAAADGTLTLDKLIFVSAGHRTLFTNLATAASTLLERWDLASQSMITILLALISLVVLLLLMRRSQPGAVALAIIPFSLLLFAVYRSYNWWSVRHSHWYFANVFFLVALWAVTRPRLTVLNFIGALIFAWCATYSMATGMLVWPCLLIALWVRGYRHWRAYLIWIVMAAISVALYVNNTGVIPGTPHPDVHGGDAVLSARLPTLPALVEFLLKYLGGTLVVNESLAVLVTVLGLIGLLLFALHAALLWRFGRDRSALAPWLALAAFALGSGVFIGLGRINYSGLDRVFSVQYTVASSLFWVALVALIAIMLRQLYRRDSTAALRLLVNVDAVALVTALGFYGYSTVTSLQAEVTTWHHELGWTRTGLLPVEQCAADFPVTRVVSCMDDIVDPKAGDLNRLDNLAARHLTIYAHLPPRSILPDEVRADSPLLMATSNAWINVHGREWLLGGVRDKALFHLVAGGNHLDDVVGIPQPLGRVAVDASQATTQALSDWLNNATEAWVLETSDAISATAPYIARLESLDYRRIYFRTYIPPEAPLNLTLLGFERMAEAPPVLYRLGLDLALREWTLESSVDVPVCSSITLRSLWSTAAVLADDYSLTVVIAGSDGQGVARSDGAPGEIATDRWQPDQLYVDRRTVTVPCDLKAGDYSLLAGMYNGDNMQSLPAAHADGGSVGGLIYLTTLHIH